MATIIAKIEDIERMIARCESRMDEIERKGRLVDLSDEEWQDLKVEKKQLDKQIKKYRSELKGLRWQNWKTTVVSFCLFGILYAFYVLFVDS